MSPLHTTSVTGLLVLRTVRSLKVIDDGTIINSPQSFSNSERCLSCTVSDIIFV